MHILTYWFSEPSSAAALEPTKMATHSGGQKYSECVLLELYKGYRFFHGYLWPFSKCSFAMLSFRDILGHLPHLWPIVVS